MVLVDLEARGSGADTGNVSLATHLGNDVGSSDIYNLSGEGDKGR